MKIYDETKTQELIDPDLERGYIYKDKRVVRHHEAIEEKIIKSVEEIKNELRLQGKEIIQGLKGNWYVVQKKFPATNERPEGRIAEEIKPVVNPAKEAWDEYEDIQVYHPFSDEEYIKYLRAERERICFSVINRGAAWYNRLTPEQNEELQEWYQEWLDVTETRVKPTTPTWV